MREARRSLGLSLLPQNLCDSYHGHEFFSPKPDTHLIKKLCRSWTDGQQMCHKGQWCVTELADPYEVILAEVGLSVGGESQRNRRSPGRLEIDYWSLWRLCWFLWIWSGIKIPATIATTRLTKAISRLTTSIEQSFPDK